MYERNLPPYLAHDLDVWKGLMTNTDCTVLVCSCDK